MEHFPITPNALTHLRRKDPRLGAVIEAYSPLQRPPVEPDLFLSLVRSILGQQISMKAQDTVWARFLAAFEAPTPERLSETPVETLKSVGTSLRKAHYIQGAAAAFQTPAYHPHHLETLSDADFIQVLTQLKGVGAWTAEMLLLFTLKRPDVLSFGDSALKNGLRLLHGMDTVGRKEFEFFRSLYRPYGSTAALYLWEVSSRGVPPSLADHPALPRESFPD